MGDNTTDLKEIGVSMRNKIDSDQGKGIREPL